MADDLITAGCVCCAKRITVYGTHEADYLWAGHVEVLHGPCETAGRPVLVVPYIQRAGLELNQLMLCWDGSRSAARAAADAMPFIQRAKAVEVVIVASEPAGPEASSAWTRPLGSRTSQNPSPPRPFMCG